MSKIGRTFATAAAGCCLALTTLPGSAATAQAAGPEQSWNSGPVRFKAANGGSECLFVEVPSQKVGLTECTENSGSTNNWYMEPWNDRGLFLLKNIYHQKCLDMNLTDVYISKCDPKDSGQVMMYLCDDKKIMAMGPTTKLTWWNDKTVSATFNVGTPKVQWTAHPQVPQSCR